MENQAFKRSIFALGEANTPIHWAIDLCDYCFGRGWLYSRIYLSCPDCDGKGKIKFDSDGDQPGTLSFIN